MADSLLLIRDHYKFPTKYVDKEPSTAAPPVMWTGTNDWLNHQ